MNNNIFSKLSKNFRFLEGEEFKSKWKNEIINGIQEAEKFDNFDNCIISLWKALESIINDFFEKSELWNNEINSNSKVSTKIKYLQNLPNMNISNYFFALMWELNYARNFEAHKHNDENKIPIYWTKSDIIAKLQRIFVIAKVFYDNDEIKDIPEKFDESIYQTKNEKNEINAISIKQRQEENKFLNPSSSLEIDKDSIRSWLSIPNSKLVVPIYQRKYEWKTQNIEVLLEDIKSRMNDGHEHYFGTIAQKKKMGEKNNDPNQIKIIDGQQRITTSLLIICAARDILKEKQVFSLDWLEEITKNHNDKKLSKYIYNPGGSNYENEIFKNILDNEYLSNDKKNDSKYYSNYQVIYEFIKKEFTNINDIYNFVNTFLTQFKVASINFDYHKFSNKKEMEIFENLNSKGLDLSTTDLIKNHIFNYCNDETLNEKENENKIPSEYNIISNIIGEKELENFYMTLSEFKTGRELKDDKRIRFNLMKESIDFFLSKHKKIQNFEDYKKLINLLKEYVYLYNEAITDKQPFIEFLQLSNIINTISDKKKKRLFVYYIYIIYRYLKVNNKKFDFLANNNQNFDLNKNDIKSIQNLFLEITKFLIKAKIISKQGDSRIKRKLIEISNKYLEIEKYKNIEINKLCQQIIDDIKNSTSSEYTFNDFKLNLETNNNHNQVIELLVLTEKIMNDNLFGDGEHITRKTQSIEHIMPQDLNEWLKEIDQEEKEEFSKQAEIYKNKIGNYLILTIPMNAKNKNNLFRIKKQKTYDKLYSPLYKNDNEEIDISRKLNWTFEDIDKRTRALIEYITKNVITE